MLLQTWCDKTKISLLKLIYMGGRGDSESKRESPERWLVRPLSGFRPYPPMGAMRSLSIVAPSREQTEASGKFLSSTPFRPLPREREKGQTRKYCHTVPQAQNPVPYGFSISVRTKLSQYALKKPGFQISLVKNKLPCVVRQPQGVNEPDLTC
jgi:hypothetical protein